jgi:hypothetical protein
MVNNDMGMMWKESAAAFRKGHPIITFLHGLRKITKKKSTQPYSEQRIELITSKIGSRSGNHSTVTFDKRFI